MSDRAKVISLQPLLHEGESEVVVLAEELHADLVIMDETAGRRELVRRGIAVVGAVCVMTVGVAIWTVNLAMRSWRLVKKLKRGEFEE